ncbi:hypothetical protein ACFRI7_29715 [Streptomyces sp. NPDC056716]|uniref:hypothetical protein n=1 Tax=unclassified Streptomyces TaxID=2593676 RepID=UPI0036775C57
MSPRPDLEEGQLNPEYAAYCQTDGDFYDAPSRFTDADSAESVSSASLLLCQGGSVSLIQCF